MSRFEFDEAKVKARFRAQTNLARRLLKSEVAKDTEKFVPMKSGYLKNSVTSSLRSNNEYIVYNAPYARFLYYGYVMVGHITHRPFAKRGETKVKTNKKLVYGKVHPMACAYWFEKSKALYRDNWLKVARKVYRNGN